MTKQLRKQFILVNMLLVGTVLLVVFAALGVSTYRRQVQDSQRVLERYFMEKGNTPSPKLDFGAHRDWKDFPMRFSFCAVLDSDGGLVSYQSENLTLSRQTVEQAVQAAAEEVESTQKESGTLSGLDLRYLAKEQDGQLRIAFVERTQEYASMQDFLVARRRRIFMWTGIWMEPERHRSLPGLVSSIICWTRSVSILVRT